MYVKTRYFDRDMSNKRVKYALHQKKNSPVHISSVFCSPERNKKKSFFMRKELDFRIPLISPVLLADFEKPILS